MSKPDQGIIVFGRRNSLNVQKVLWALGELKLPYLRHDVGGQFGYPEDYPALNPNQVVPTIRDGGLTLWESGAIVRYLASRYGRGDLWPEDPTRAALADQWMDWHKDKVSSGFFDVFINQIRLPAARADQGAIARGSKVCAKQFQLLDAHLAQSTYLAGEHFTAGDIPMGAMTYRYRLLEIDRPALPNVERWFSALAERPAFQQHVAIPFGRNVDEWTQLEADSAGIQ